MGMKTPRVVGCLEILFKLQAVMFKEQTLKHWGVSVVVTRSPVQPVKTVARVYFGTGGVLVSLGGCHRAGSVK